MVKRIDYFPSSESMQNSLKPIYEIHEGWQKSTQGAKSWSDLPALAIKYVRRIEELFKSSGITFIDQSQERGHYIGKGSIY